MPSTYLLIKIGILLFITLIGFWYLTEIIFLVMVKLLTKQNFKFRKVPHRRDLFMFLIFSIFLVAYGASQFGGACLELMNTIGLPNFSKPM